MAGQAMEERAICISNIPGMHQAESGAMRLPGNHVIARSYGAMGLLEILVDSLSHILVVPKLGNNHGEMTSVPKVAVYCVELDPMSILAISLYAINILLCG